MSSARKPPPSGLSLKLDELHRAAEQLKALEDRARVRLSQVSGRKLYVAIVGLQTAFDAFEFHGPAIVLRRVEETPGEVALARVLKRPGLFGVVGRYSRGIAHELVVDREAVGDQSALDFAWWTLSALRARSLAEFLVPACADYPWAAMAGLKSAECDVQLLEDVPKAKRLAPPVTVTTDHAEWVRDNLERFIALLEDPAYRLATDALTTHQHEASERTMTAILWAGIEGIFKAKVETTFRVASYVATYIEPAGDGRLVLFNRVKRLYNVRSQAVHGEPIGASKLREHVIDVRSLLADVVCKAAEQGAVPTVASLEAALFATGV